MSDTTLSYLMTPEKYHANYKSSLEKPMIFWAEQAHNFVSWFKPWVQVSTGSFTEMNLEWFVEGKLNACYNCLDRHLPDRANKSALIWEGNEQGNSITLTYAELYEKVCRFANVLKNKGIKKGDRVAVYLPMIPEVVVAMLACARIGAVHSVIFAGFSADAIRDRIQDADCRLMITADASYRGQKLIPLKQNVDLALTDCPRIHDVIIVRHTGEPVDWMPGRDNWYHEMLLDVDADCPCVEMDAQDPLFVLYTSGSTGKPKGILHVTGGYLVYVATTFNTIFDYQERDIFWCTADAGWITGHSYVVYAPLCLGATTVIYESVPNYPTPARYWEIVDKHQVSIFYTSPTAIRALRHEGNAWLESTERSSLRLLGTVGEPINPDVWEWYYTEVGHQRCPIVDTWWQTETGGILISALPHVTPPKPGSATWPFFGIKPVIVDDQGQPVKAGQSGKLLISQPWPGMMKTIYGNPDRFYNAYFRDFPGYYLTGDSAYCDAESNYWILGRSDDVLKISGHRIGTAEVENAILTCDAVSEAAVVAAPHEIKGEAIYAFVTLKAGVEANDVLKATLIAQVRKTIGAIASPDYIQWAESLPKTRSGKIMRRILRKIACGDTHDLGDTSTLTDAGIVEKLAANRLKI